MRLILIAHIVALLKAEHIIPLDVEIDSTPLLLPWLKKHLGSKTPPRLGHLAVLASVLNHLAIEFGRDGDYKEALAPFHGQLIPMEEKKKKLRTLRRISPWDLEQRLIQGQSIRSIAKEYGISIGAMYKNVKLFGFEFYLEGRMGKRITTMLKEGKTIEEIIAHQRCSRATVYAYRQKLTPEKVRNSLNKA